MTRTTNRTTNRGMASFIRSLAPFQAHSVHAEWLDYPSHTGRLPEEWAQDLRRTFERSRTTNADNGERMVYVIFSYATPVAWYTDGDGWVEPDVKYSPTTSKQMGQIRGGYDWRSARKVVAT